MLPFRVPASAVPTTPEASSAYPPWETRSLTTPNVDGEPPGSQSTLAKSKSDWEPGSVTSQG